MLWYEQEAINWENEALPIGNGFIGAMIFGGKINDTIQYNEKTLWSGGLGEFNEYCGGNLTGAWEAVQEIRTLLSKGEAPNENLYKKVCGNPKGFGAYQSFGTINLEFLGVDEKNISNYRRELDLNEGISRVFYNCDNVSYTREYFCNYPSNVIAINIKANLKNKLNFIISNSCSHEKYNVNIHYDSIVLKGKLKNGMSFESLLKIIVNDGAITHNDKNIKVMDATSCTIILTAGTDYINSYPNYKGPNPHNNIIKRINTAIIKGYEYLKKEHIDDYQNLFQRVKLNLTNKKSYLSTDKLLNAYKNEQSNYLEELFFNYGRYLLISSSRIGSLPANLQGVWNNSNNPPWSSDYHFNVNLQMNYWPVDVTNLSPCAVPLIEYVNSLVEPGRLTAKIHCGINDGGWVVNTMNNPFGFTAMGWEFDWGWAPTCNAWICQNLWQYYKFNGDKDYLKSTIYPIMKEASEFWSKFLVEYTDKYGKVYLVSSPSFSPEHGPRTFGTSYDQELIWQLFTDTIHGSEELNIDRKFREVLIDKRERLLKPKIGKHGQVQEWIEDIDSPYDKHRHISHLVGLYPGNQINYKEIEMFNAAKVTMNNRGDGGTGWSKANKINLWARLLDGNRAHKLLQEQLKSSILSNLFDTHPPFQIDGNFGAVSGIAEMLLQSHLDIIEPLPALPKAWKDGSYEGLKARGNFEISAYWSNSTLDRLIIKSLLGNICTLKYENINKFVLKDIDGMLIPYTVLDFDKIKFSTIKNKIYFLQKI